MMFFGVVLVVAAKRLFIQMTCRKVHETSVYWYPLGARRRLKLEGLLGLGTLKAAQLDSLTSHPDTLLA